MERIYYQHCPRSDLDERLREDRRRKKSQSHKVTKSQSLIKAIFTPLPRNGIKWRYNIYIIYYIYYYRI